MPCTIPTGQHHPCLSPAEHPGDGAQILDPLAFGPARRTRSDLERGNFRYWCHLSEKACESVGFVNQPAIGGKGCGGQFIHRAGKSFRIGCGQRVRLQRGEQGCRCDRLQIGDGIVDRSIFRRDNLALFGDADAAVYGAARLRLNRAKGRAAATSHSSAPAMEQLHGHACCGKYRGKRERGLLQTPCRGEIAAILVRIGIADHHFLMAARSGQCMHPG